MPSQDELIRDLVRRVDKLEQDRDRMRSQQLFPAASSVGTLRSVSLTNNGNGLDGSTHVVIFNVDALGLPSKPITRMRFTFEAAAAESFTITNAYVGHAAITGNVYDFLSTPTQITFSSGAASVVIPAGGSSISDLILFSYNKTSALTIAMYCNGGATSDAPKIATGLSNINRYSRPATNEAGTVLKTAGYTLTAGGDIAINLIESNGF